MMNKCKHLNTFRMSKIVKNPLENKEEANSLENQNVTSKKRKGRIPYAERDPVPYTDFIKLKKHLKEKEREIAWGKWREKEYKKCIATLEENRDHYKRVYDLWLNGARLDRKRSSGYHDDWMRFMDEIKVLKNSVEDLEKKFIPAQAKEVKEKCDKWEAVLAKNIDENKIDIRKIDDMILQFAGERASDPDMGLVVAGRRATL